MSSASAHVPADATTSLIDEIKALRDSTEDLFILLEHIWQNRDDLRLQLSVVLTDRGREAIEESIGCYECDADAPPGLAQALHDGWIDIVYEPGGRAANFVGWCPGCQRAHEEKEWQLNRDPIQSKSLNQLEPAFHQAETKVEDSSARDSDVVPMDPITAPGPAAAGVVQVAPLSGSNTLSDESSQRAPPSERYRKTTPLATRLHLQRYMEAMVRAIGYDVVPREEARARLQPLVERYGRATIEQAVEELLERGPESAPGTVRLRENVRQLARQILGAPRVDAGPPQAASNPSATRAGRPIAPPTASSTGKVNASSHTSARPFMVPMTNPGLLKAVKMTRQEALAAFQGHLEERHIVFERIDNATRLRYTDKHIGTLDFIICESGEPPELITIRSKLTTTQAHDLSEWRAIIGDGAFVSMIWQYVDPSGNRTWETIEVSTEEQGSATRPSAACSAHDEEK